MFPYISIVAAILILFRLKIKNHRELSVLLLVGLVTFILFLRTDNFTFHKYLFNIPGFSSLRSLTRIIGIDLLFFAAASGILVNYLITKFPKRQVLVYILIFGFVVMDNYVSPSRTYRFSKAIALERHKDLTAKMEYLPPGTVVSYEPDDIENSTFVQLDAMLATQALGLICINGYTATAPETFTPYWFEPNEKNRIYWLNSVRIDPYFPVVIK